MMAGGGSSRGMPFLPELSQLQYAQMQQQHHDQLQMLQKQYTDNMRKKRDDEHKQQLHKVAHLQAALSPDQAQRVAELQLALSPDSSPANAESRPAQPTQQHRYAPPPNYDEPQAQAQSQAQAPPQQQQQPQYQYDPNQQHESPRGRRPVEDHKEDDGWNNRIDYASKYNPARYVTHRAYFSHVPSVVGVLPRKPELKSLVLKGRDFFVSTRDPRFYNPVAESGWNKREPQQPRHIEQAMWPEGQHAPVVIEPPTERADSKLLIPFLHHWPPPFRYDYLKKHSRAPLSPFLASQHGYEVPPELYMSARQRREVSAQEEAYAHQQAIEMGYAYAAAPPPPPPAAKPNLADPIERARARAHIHTTYWRTVPPEGLPPQQQHYQQTSQSHKQPWDSRHHLVPRPPRSAQTRAKQNNKNNRNNAKHGRRAVSQQPRDASAYPYDSHQQSAPPAMFSHTLPPMFPLSQPQQHYDEPHAQHYQHATLYDHEHDAQQQQQQYDMHVHEQQQQQQQQQLQPNDEPQQYQQQEEQHEQQADDEQQQQDAVTDEM